MSIILIAFASSVAIIDIVHQPWFAGTSLALFAMLLAAVFGAFRRRSVVGPIRLNENDAPLIVWAIPFLAFLSSLAAQSIYVLALHGHELAQLENSPAAKQAWKMPPRDEIVSSFLIFAAGFATLLWADRYILRDGVRKLGFSLAKLQRGIVVGILGSFVALPLTEAASQLFQWLSIHYQFAQPKEHELLSQLHLQTSSFLRGMIAFTAIVAAPITEEILFRGHVQTAFAHTLRAMRGKSLDVEPRDAPWVRWLAICLTAALFAAVHNNGAGSRWMLPPLFLLAVCFGYVYERTGNLWATIVMHSIFNSAAIAFALAS